jgi:hypothetical protein
MVAFRNKSAVTIVGSLIGWLAYHFEGPWWLYLIALAVFLVGLMSFSVGGAPDPSGYEKRADDSRVDGGGHGGYGGGEC